jgi:hypothetical protein
MFTSEPIDPGLLGQQADAIRDALLN